MAQTVPPTRGETHDPPGGATAPEATGTLAPAPDHALSPQSMDPPPRTEPPRPAQPSQPPPRDWPALTAPEAPQLMSPAGAPHAAAHTTGAQLPTPPQLVTMPPAATTPWLPTPQHLQPTPLHNAVTRAGLRSDNLRISPAGPALRWSVSAPLHTYAEPPGGHPPTQPGGDPSVIPAPPAPAPAASYRPRLDCVRQAFNGITGLEWSHARFHQELRGRPGYFPGLGADGGAVVQWRPLLQNHFGSAFVALPLRTGTRHWLTHDSAVGAVACTFAGGVNSGHAEFLPRGTTAAAVAAFDACVGHLEPYVLNLVPVDSSTRALRRPPPPPPPPHRRDSEISENFRKKSIY
eukprot:SAG31_NODE_6257_length_2100_cov_10.508246_3_plen_348_part_00